MRAVIEPSGCSVRRGAVQIRIDLFLDPGDKGYDEHHVMQEDDTYIDAPFHSHFVQLSPDVTDADVKKEAKKVLDEFGGEWAKGNHDLGQYWNRKPKKKVYAPFKVDAPFEALVFDALREGKTPALVGENMSAHLVRCAVKGLDIAARKDEFKAVR